MPLRFAECEEGAGQPVVKRRILEVLEVVRKSGDCTTYLMFYRISTREIFVSIHCTKATEDKMQTWRAKLAWDASQSESALDWTGPGVVLIKRASVWAQAKFPVAGFFLFRRVFIYPNGWGVFIRIPPGGAFGQSLQTNETLDFLGVWVRIHP